MPTALNCANVTNCTNTSWDLAFCICNGGGCVPADNPSSPSADSISGLVGVYTTDWTIAGTAASTGSDPGTWSSISSALHDDGTFASIEVPAFTGDAQNQGGQYIVLTGGGFNVPDGSTIQGFAIATKGKHTSLKTYGFDILPLIYNIAITFDGVLYYCADPTFDSNWSGNTPSAPYSLSQPLECAACSGPSNVAGVVSVIEMAIFNTYAGNMPGCAPLDWPQPAEKDFTTNPGKTTWTPAEVNDSTFGVALSVENNSDNGGNDELVQGTVFLDTIGLAVYYTPPAGGGGSRPQPNLCINC